MIERSTRMKEGAKTKIQDKLTVLREKLKIKDNKKLRARTCADIIYGISKVHIRKVTWVLSTYDDGEDYPEEDYVTDGIDTPSNDMYNVHSANLESPPHVKSNIARQPNQLSCLSNQSYLQYAQ